MKQEPSKKTSPFAAFQSKPAQLKTEKDSANSSKDTNGKEKKVSPKKSSPKTNQTSSKAQQGKSSIASFFAKPTTSTASKPDKSIQKIAAKVERVDIKDEPVVDKTNDTKTTQKRPHSNTSGEPTATNILRFVFKLILSLFSV